MLVSGVFYFYLYKGMPEGQTRKKRYLPFPLSRSSTSGATNAARCWIDPGALAAGTAGEIRCRLVGGGTSAKEL